MEDWCTFTIDRHSICHIEWPLAERDGLSSSLIKRELFVLVLSDNRDWHPVSIEANKTTDCVTIMWHKPYRLELRLCGDDERNYLSTGYEPVERHFEMTQLVSALMRYVSRESSLEKMRNQFCDLFEAK